MTECRKLMEPPKSVSTIIFSKFINVLACYWAIFCFLAIRIILRVCQTHQATIKNSSIPWEISKASDVLDIAETRNSRLQKITTIASKMFHQRRVFAYGSLKYLSQPTSLTRQAKSAPISRFRRSSRIMKAGLSATLNPSQIVTRIKMNAKSRSKM